MPNQIKIPTENLNMCSNSNGKSETMVKLVQRLNLYCPNHNLDTLDDTTNFGDSTTQKGNRAAVLICLFEDENGQIRVILTKRSSTLSSHSGEVSLPGGKRDETDRNDVETALREANEEIGLDPCIVEVVTVLEPFTNKRNVTVYPVIGVIWNWKAFNPAPNVAEVESIFYAPLDMFLKDENRKEEEREWMGYKYLLHFFHYQTENECYVIWALTAAILIKAASIVYERPPNFEERRPRFWNRSRQ